MQNKSGHIIKHIFFWLLLAVMLLPAAQARFKLFTEKPLFGGFNLEQPPDPKWFTWRTWFAEIFQIRFNKAIEDNVGFRNFFVRLNNQVNFSLYKVSENPNIVVGKNNCIFEEGYILSYLGRNFVGKTLINERLRRTKWVQDYLKKEKNIDLIIVFEPGKGSFHSRYIPDRYQPHHKELSNYDYYVERCRESGIRHIDLCSYFISMRDTSRHPLFPLYGVHWSTYGMTLASDSLTRYIEGIRQIDMPDFDGSDIVVTNQNKDVDVDWDAEQAMNLLFRLPYATMAYPQLKFGDTLGKTRPRVLTIADSYYWSMYNSGIPQHCYKDHQFWYYYLQVYPYIWDNSHLVGDLKVKEEIEKQEVILVMVTEMNLYRAFWQFTDDLYRWYNPEFKEDPFYNACNDVINTDHWLRNAIAKAKKQKTTVENVINEEARLRLKNGTSH